MKRLAFALIALSSPLAAQDLLRHLHRHLPMDNGASAAIASGDLDGDGDADAYQANGSVRDYVYVGAGDGTFAITFATVPAKPTDGFVPSKVALADVDGDGDLDVVHAMIQADLNRLFRNDGGLVFTDVTDTALNGTTVTARDLAVADVDGDDDLDILFANQSFTLTNELLLNDGSGVFTYATGQMPQDGNGNNGVRFADLDADGDLDAVTAGVLEHAYLNDGAGNFTDKAGAFASDGITDLLDVGDVDGDGFPDVVKELSNDVVGAFLNDGTASFTLSAGAIPATSQNVQDLELADLTGNGDLDLVLAADGPTVVYLGAGTGFFAEGPLFDDDADSNGVATADVDGDTDLDLLFSNEFEQNTLYFGDGTGAFVNPDAVFLPAETTSDAAAALGDVNGDGWSDALVVGMDGLSYSRLLLNDGAGALIETSGQIPDPDQFPYDVELSDFDGDGDLDAMVATGYDDGLFLNDGMGVFSDDSAAMPPIGEQSVELVLGDMDDDGDDDAFVIVGNSLFDPDVLLRNDLSDTQSFADVSHQLPINSTRAGDAQFGDFDRDGDLDILFCGRPSPLRFYANDGAGVFTHLAALTPAESYHVRSMAAGDVDADGDVDVLTGNTTGTFSGEKPDRLFLNEIADPVGTFVLAVGQLPAVSDEHTTAVALEDMDGDGDLDALMERPSALAVWTNDGAGNFADDGGPGSSFGGYSISDIDATDLDGDGDPDVLATATISYQDLYFHGTARHVAWRAIPRVGKDLVLDVYGPAGEPYVLGFAQGKATIPFPPYGTFMLDPATFVHVFEGVIGPGGVVSPGGPVPNNPALVGFSLYWQGAVGFDFKLTNAETTTFTSL